MGQSKIKTKSEIAVEANVFVDQEPQGYITFYIPSYLKGLDRGKAIEAWAGIYFWILKNPCSDLTAIQRLVSPEDIESLKKYSYSLPPSWQLLVDARELLPESYGEDRIITFWSLPEEACEEENSTSISIETYAYILKTLGIKS